jgi:hypothetical protein
MEFNKGCQVRHNVAESRMLGRTSLERSVAWFKAMANAIGKVAIRLGPTFRTAFHAVAALIEKTIVGWDRHVAGGAGLA